MYIYIHRVPYYCQPLFLFAPCKVLPFPAIYVVLLSQCVCVCDVYNPAACAVQQ